MQPNTVREGELSNLLNSGVRDIHLCKQLRIITRMGTQLIEVSWQSELLQPCGAKASCGELTTPLCVWCVWILTILQDSHTGYVNAVKKQIMSQFGGTTDIIDSSSIGMNSL